MIDKLQYRALRNLRFNWAAAADDVWQGSPVHVDGLHPQGERRIELGIDDAAERTTANPIGLVIEGVGGTGKTHLLGWARQQVQERDGYFFLVDFSSGNEFWANTARQMRAGLQTIRAGTNKTQLDILMHHLAVQAKVPPGVTEAVSGGVPPHKIELKNFLKALIALDSDMVLSCQATLRALTLYASQSLEHQTLGDNYLASRPPLDEHERQHRIDWELDPDAPSPRDVVEQISRIVALSGPSVIAVDQIDALIDAAAAARAGAAGTEGAEWVDRLAEVAGGLMDLRQITRRTLCVVSCIPVSWRRVQAEAVSTVADRFRTSVILGTSTEAGVARELVEKRMAHAFGRVNFPPPHPTWPVAPEAFATAVNRTPRQLLQAIDQHIDSCLANNEVVELVDFAKPGDGHKRNGEEEPTGEAEAFKLLDHRFEQLKGWFKPENALDAETEDVEVPKLLAGAIPAWIMEQDDAEVFEFDIVNAKKPDVHARLRKILDPETERQEQWCIRAISQANAQAVQTRLRNAMEASGLGRPGRALIIMRAVAWPSGPKTAALVAEFEGLGGIVVSPTADDLACYYGLRKMSVDADPNFASWLRSRRPASRTELFTVG